MISLLACLFIKNRMDYSDAAVRQQYGVLCGGFGVFLNLVLFAAKFIFGTLCASVSMVADAFNNLSDAASSIVQILGFKLASKKPDPEHPFGHGRIEYIAGLIVSFLICYMGIELIKSSVEAIRNPKPLEANIFSIIVLVFAVLIKFYMYIYNHGIGKKINSVSMEATAKDSLSDTISTFVVIVSIVAGRFTSLPVDGIAGVIVGIFIIKTGLESVHDTIEPLLGAAPSKEFVDQIEKEMLNFEPIIGVHDLVVHDYGPGRVMISIHAEVPGEKDIFELHDVIDQAEDAISEKLNCDVVIHMDPVDSNNERLAELKVCAKNVCHEIAEGLSVHDVRMVPGITHTNLVFDVVKPFECKLSDLELTALINKKIKEANADVNCVIKVDQPFC